MSEPSNAARNLGRGAAIACTVFSLAYVAAQVLEWRGLLGSHGGPESLSTPLGLAVLLTPSLLLGSSFLILIAALYEFAEPHTHVFARVALVFATAYATLISLVYFVQLTLIAPRLASGDTVGLEAFLFVPYRSFLFAIDLLGYSFMCISSLFAAFALPAGRASASVARGFLLANGLLLPFLALQMFFPVLIYPAALWAIVFPSATFALAVVFSDPTLKSMPT